MQSTDEIHTLQRASIRARRRRLNYNESGIEEETFEPDKRRYVWGENPDGSARRNVRQLARRPPRASQACRSCAASKVRCDDLATCRRCQKKGVPCLRSTYWRRTETDQLSLSEDESYAAERSYSNHATRGASQSAGTSPSYGSTLAESATLGLNEAAAPAPTQVDASVTQLAPPQSTAIIDPLLSLEDMIYTYDGMFDFPFAGSDEWPCLASFNNPPIEQTIDLLSATIGSSDHQQGLSYRQNSANRPDLAEPPCNDVAVPSTAVEAYDSTMSRWHPGRADHLTPDLEFLSIPLEEQSSMSGQMGYFDPDVVLDKISPRMRDEMIITVSNRFAAFQLQPTIPFFPSVDMLDELLRIFLTTQKDGLTSFIHLPLFSLRNCDISLLMACIAAGAVSSPKLIIYRFGLALTEVLRWMLPLKADRDNTLTRSTPYIQALVIVSDIAFWCGDKRKSEISDIQSAFATTMLRHARRFDGSSYACIAPSLNQSLDSVPETWKRWADQESIKRTVYQHFIKSTLRAIVGNMSSQISCMEISIPLPENNQLWHANSANEWNTIYLNLKEPANNQNLTLTDCLANGLTSKPFPPLQDRELTTLLTMYFLLSILVEDRRRIIGFSGNQVNQLAGQFASQTFISRRITTLCDEIRDEVDRHASGCRSTIAFILEFYNFYSASPNHLTEALLSNQRRPSAHKTLKQLSEWRQSRLARVAIWHAGQLFRVCRMIPPKDRTNFHVYTLFHAALCLWTYGKTNPLVSTNRVGGHQSGGLSDTPKIRLDGNETVESQRWIEHNHGAPYISKLSDIIGAMDEFVEMVPIAPYQTLKSSFMSPVLGMIENIFSHEVTGKRFPLLQSICKILHGLNNVSSQS